MPPNSPSTMAQSPSSSSDIKEALVATKSVASIHLQRSNDTLNAESLYRPRRLFVRIADRAKNKEYMSSLMAIDPENQGQDLMSKLQERKFGGSSRRLRYLEAGVDLLLMQRTCVFLVTIALVSEDQIDMRNHESLIPILILLYSFLVPQT